MALRSSSPENPVEPTADAAETLNPSPSQRALPESGDKRIAAVILAIVVIGAMFAPWWKTSGELLLQTGELSGWDLLILGFGIGGYAPATGFSVFGNVLFGALTTVPLLIVAVLLIVRAVKPRAIPAWVVAMWALFALLTLGWLIVVGWARLNATLGIFPVTWGALIEAMAMAFTAVAMWNWWRRGERGLYPRRGSLRLTQGGFGDAEETSISELLDEHSSEEQADAEASEAFSAAETRKDDTDSEKSR